VKLSHFRGFDDQNEVKLVYVHEVIELLDRIEYLEDRVESLRYELNYLNNFR
jgi:hypothetical protein